MANQMVVIVHLMSDVVSRFFLIVEFVELTHKVHQFVVLHHKLFHQTSLNQETPLADSSNAVYLSLNVDVFEVYLLLFLLVLATSLSFLFGYSIQLNPVKKIKVVMILVF